MKKPKILNIYYIILLLVSLICLFSFKQKGNDFFIALSSITADLSIVIASIIVIYTMFICCNSFYNTVIKKKSIKKDILLSLLIILISIIIIFISFINVFSHKNIFEYIYRIIINKESLDILFLFIKSLFIYLLLYFIIVSIIAFINNKK